MTVCLNLEGSVGSWFLAQPLDSTALQKNTRLTEWVRLRFFLNAVKPMGCTINTCPADLDRLKVRSKIDRFPGCKRENKNNFQDIFSSA